MGRCGNVVASRCAAVVWPWRWPSPGTTGARSYLTTSCFPVHVPLWMSQPCATTSLSTGGGSASCMRLSDGGFQGGLPFDMWSRSFAVANIL